MSTNSSSCRKAKFWGGVIIYFILMISDGILTYIGTPDLSLEGNPLVSVFGLGWGALFIASAATFALYVALAYYTFFRYKRPVIQCQGFKQYFSGLNFDRTDKFIWTFYKTPKHIAPYIACMGYTYIIVFPIDRLIIVLQWIGFLSGSNFYNWYKYNIRSSVPFGKFDLLISMILMVFLMCYWFFKEYKINKKTLEMKLNNSAV